MEIYDLFYLFGDPSIKRKEKEKKLSASTVEGYSGSLIGPAAMPNLPATTPDLSHLANTAVRHCALEPLASAGRQRVGGVT